MKRASIIVLFLLSFLQSSAQKNRVEIGIGNYKIYNVIAQSEDLPTQLQLTYSRSINNRVNFFLSYVRLPLNSLYLSVEEYLMAKDGVGKIETRGKYSYIDIGGVYKLKNYHSHTLSLSAAVSLAYGKNRYLTHVVWSEPEPGEPYGHPFEAAYETKKEAYLGGLAGLRYDYTFWKNRINIGVDFAARYYFGKKNAHLENPYPNTIVPDPNIPGGRHSFPFQINYGLHVGYNF
ncbi:MAG: hypothetical protein QM642_07705 [Edaphocola sp.]